MKNTNRTSLSISGLCLILLTILFSISQAHAQGGSLIVNTLAEGDDGVCGDTTSCTLREAVKYAPAGSTITFSVTGIIEMKDPAISIAKDLTIIGPGAGSLTLSGNGNDGVTIRAASLFIISNGIVGISGLTLSNGTGSAISSSQNYGGAIYMTGGALILTSCILSSNNAIDGGGIWVGGGASLTINRSTLSGNRAGSGGSGGISMNAGSSLLMTDSTISGNISTNGVGGGIYLRTNTTATVTNSTISGNRANTQFGGGGGFFNDGNLTIINSTISGNLTTTPANGSSIDGGGGIKNVGQLTVANSTFTGNEAANGGGIHTSLSGATLSLSNSIVAGNAGYTGRGPDLLGNATAGDYNLLQNPSGAALSGTHNVIAQPALLGTLVNNGGPTQTHALFPSSPAIDAGDPFFDTTATPYDQRGSGFPRKIGTAIDIGAYELKPDPSQSGSSFVVNTLRVDSDNGVCGVNSCTLREAVKYAPAGATITFSVTGTISLTLREIVIDKTLTITGPTSAPGITVSGNNVSRIFSFAEGISVTLSNLTLTRGNGVGSLESQTGGAIYNKSRLTLRASTLSGNRAVGKGGAIHNSTVGFVTVFDSTFSGNTVVRTCTTCTNTGIGGAIYNGNSFRVNNSTIYSNTADFSGGGIHTEAPGANVSLRLTGSIVAGNTAPNSPDLNGTVTLGDYNLVQNTSGATLAGTNNITGQPALLGPLANNGGPTLTHALLFGSPAIDQGIATGTDQRGLTRPVDLLRYANATGGNGADIGAFEMQTVPGTTAATVSVSGRVTAGGRGISNAVVHLTNQNGEILTVKTSRGGYYTFTDLAAGETYIFNVFSKRYQFDPKVINLTEDLSEVDFTAQ